MTYMRDLFGSLQHMQPVNYLTMLGMGIQHVQIRSLTCISVDVLWLIQDHSPSYIHKRDDLYMYIYIYEIHLIILCVSLMYVYRYIVIPKYKFILSVYVCVKLYAMINESSAT